MCGDVFTRSITRHVRRNPLFFPSRKLSKIRQEGQRVERLVGGRKILTHLVLSTLRLRVGGSSVTSIAGDSSK